MRMTSIKMKKLLEERFSQYSWEITYDKDKDSVRIEKKDSNQGIEIELPPFISKWEEKGDSAFTELEDFVREALTVMNEEQMLQGREKDIYPVIRSASFPKETKSGQRLIFDEHTAETRIYYALDLGKSYRLIDEAWLQSENWPKNQLREVATFNVRSLPVSWKSETVAGNTFYFHSKNDGYDASRILNISELEKLKAEIKGEFAFAIPHQDVLIAADIQNETGYDILAQITMKFFAEGRVPVTALPFLYEDQKLEPIFILAQNKKK
ncbi:DUF1444 domain-containing protein [Bacillaceae bacterium S4-13-56]